MVGSRVRAEKDRDQLRGLVLLALGRAADAAAWPDSSGDPDWGERVCGLLTVALQSSRAAEALLSAAFSDPAAPTPWPSVAEQLIEALDESQRSELDELVDLPKMIGRVTGAVSDETMRAGLIQATAAERALLAQTGLGGQRLAEIAAVLAEIRDHLVPPPGRAAGSGAQVAGEDLRRELGGYLQRVERQQRRRLPRYLPAGANMDALTQRVRVHSGLRPDPGSGGPDRRGDTCAPASADRDADPASDGGSKIMSWIDVADEQARVVVLAQPGMGKSWLVRTETARLAREARESLDAGHLSEQLLLPVALRVDELASHLLAIDEGGAGSAALAAAVARDTACRHELPDGLTTWLAGHVRARPTMLLLDALDEATPEQVAALRRPLADWCETNPDGRLLLTSRIAGYAGPPVPGAALTEVELLPLTPDQIDAYIEAWPLPDFSRAALRARLTSPDAAGLAQVPLLLALLCHLAQDPAEPLPVRRGELYQRLLRRFLTAEHRADDAPALVDSADVDRLLDVLGQVAYAFADRSAGWTDRLPARELAVTIKAALPDPGSLGRDEHAVLTRLSKGAGILVPAGDPTGGRNPPYLFLHRTFHEYLTARHLAGLLPEAWTQVVDRHLWFDPDWEQVVPLLAGELDDPRPLLRHLLNQDDDALCRALLLAAAAVTELPPHAATSAREEITEVGDSLLGLLRSTSSYLRGEAWSALRVLGEAIPERALRYLLAWLINDPKLRAAAAWALAKHPGAEVTEALLDRLEDTDASVRVAAVGALGARPGVEVTAALLARLADAEASVRRVTVEALSGRLGAEATEALLDQLEDTDASVRVAAVGALGARPGVEVTAALLARLGDAETSLREWTAKGALWRWAWEKKGPVRTAILEALRERPGVKVTAALLARLEDPSEGVWAAALEALQGRLGAEVTAAALARLEDADEWLGPVVEAPERRPGAEVTEAALARLKDPSDWVRMEALQGRPGAEVTAAVLARLEDPSEWVRAAALEALQGRAGAEVTAALLAQLEDPSEGVRLAAAHALMGRPGVEVTAALSRPREPHQPIPQALLQILPRLSWDEHGTDRALHVLLEDSQVFDEDGLDLAVTAAAALAGPAWRATDESKRQDLRRGLTALTCRTLPRPAG